MQIIIKTLILCILLSMLHSNLVLANDNVEEKQFFIHTYTNPYVGEFYSSDSVHYLQVKIQIIKIQDLGLNLKYIQGVNTSTSVTWLPFQTFNSIGNYSYYINASNLLFDLSNSGYWPDTFTNKSVQGSYSIINGNTNQTIKKDSFLFGVANPELNVIYSSSDNGSKNYNVSVHLENISVVGGELEINFNWFGGLESAVDTHKIVKNGNITQWDITNKARSVSLSLHADSNYCYATGWFKVIDNGVLTTIDSYNFSIVVMALTLVFLQKRKGNN